MIKLVRQAEERYAEASRSLIAVVRAAWPKGTTIRAIVGRDVPTLKVTGHGVHHDCGVVYASHSRTGRFHRIFPSQIV